VEKIGLGDQKRENIRFQNRVHLNCAAQVYNVRIDADVLRGLDRYFVSIVNTPRDDGSFPTYSEVLFFLQTDLRKLFGELVAEGVIERGSQVNIDMLPVIQERAHKRRPKCCFVSFTRQTRNN